MNSVSNLLKIYSLWSDRPFYYALFAIRSIDFNAVPVRSVEFLSSNNYKYNAFNAKNVLDVLFDLINSTKCTQVVIDHVMEIVYNLVSYADFKAEQVDEANQDLLVGFNLVNTKPLPFDLDAIKNQYNNNDSEGK